MKKAFILLIAVLFFTRLSMLYMDRAFHAPFRLGDREVSITIEPGAHAGEIAARLEQHGIIRSSGIFKLLLYLTGNTGRIKAGEYVFSGSPTPLDVMGKLIRGDIRYHKITFPEGLTLRETADEIRQAGFLSYEEFLRTASESDLIATLDPEAEDLEGYLFPDTYYLTAGATAKELVEMMTGRFKEVFTAAWRDRAEALGLTTREIVTLASLIEKETGLESERSRVSSVFHNRLKKNMLLQCDPTVIYAMKAAGTYRGRILRKDLEMDSPYNTYKFPWLPPGPIANPGREAIAAALYPERTSYYYFVSRNDGSHYFSATIAEHNRMVNKYQRKR